METRGDDGADRQNRLDSHNEISPFSKQTSSLGPSQGANKKQSKEEQMMEFVLPAYHAPDFTQPALAGAPDVKVERAQMDGVAPEGYHSTSMYPEYFKLNGQWRLAEESRMDCSVLLRSDGHLDVVEMRNIKKGDLVLLGRTEQGEEGIYVHDSGFVQESGKKDVFAFRTGRSRETAYSRDYDELYPLLQHEREHGNIVWVMGPACAFDSDSRTAMQRLIENGFVSGLLAGNALATHDLEAGYLKTALGQNIYTQQPHYNGHYNHLDTINEVRKCGSIPRFIEDEGQSAMRALVRHATTVICLATQLHTIATGNMTPSFRVVNGAIRPVYLYVVDISEFVVNKLKDRGSLSSVGMITNAQDFVVNVARGVGVYHSDH